MRYIALIFALTALVFSGAAIAADDEGVTLRKNSMFKPNVLPGALHYQGAEPGQNNLMRRGSITAPPQIPHTKEGLNISKEENDCMNCHDPNNQVENTPYVSAKHLYGGGITMARFQCDMCHVPQADVDPLVENENDQFNFYKVR